MCTSAKKCLLSSPVFKPRLRLGQKTQTRTLFGLDTQIMILESCNKEIFMEKVEFHFLNRDKKLFLTNMVVLESKLYIFL
jgi:hypothetical protein